MTETPQLARRANWIGPALAAAVLLAVIAGIAVFYHYRTATNKAIEKARLAMSQGDFLTADVILTDLLAKEPQNEQIIILLAQSHLQRGELEMAQDLLQRYPPDGRQAHGALALRASVLLQLQRPGAAEEVLRSGLETFPDSIKLRQQLLDIFVLQDRLFEAHQILDELDQQSHSRPALDQLWVLAKRFDLYFWQPSTEEVWPTLQAFAYHEPDNKHTFLAMAKIRLAFGEDIQATVSKLKEWAKHEPFHRETAVVLLQHLIDREPGNDPLIPNLLDEWAKHKSDTDAKYYQLTGRWQLKQQKLQQADANFRQALALDPGDWQTIHQLGTLWVRMARLNDPVDAGLAEKGAELLKIAAQVKDAHQEGDPEVLYLREWFTQPSAQPDPNFFARAAEITRRCFRAHRWQLAQRWHTLLKQLGNTTLPESFSQELQQHQSTFLHQIDPMTQN